ncbi:MAG: ABC transporter permease [Candidatus Omnitrophota bacterium]
MKTFFSELQKILLFLKKDIRLELSYKLSFMLRVLSIGLFCLVFFFLARMLGESQIKTLEKYNGDYFAFALIGMAFYSFFTVLLNSFSSRLREEQLTGTLEAIFTAPVRVPTFLAGISILSLARGFISVAIFFGVGIFVLKAGVAMSDLPVFCVTLLLCTVNFLSIGIIASSFILVFKRGNPVNWFLETVFLLAGGVIYPVSVLPGWIQKISNVLPMTYALQALRATLIPGADTAGTGHEITKLLAGAVILLPIAIIMFWSAMNIVKKRGTLAHY